MAVVDGNAGARRGLVRRLEQVMGISVVREAGDAVEALAVVGDRQPEVIVVDLRWIAPDGPEFLRRLGSAAPQAGIVVLTAYLTERERSELLQAGARAILLKEIDSGALVRTIRMIAARPVADGRRSEA